MKKNKFYTYEIKELELFGNHGLYEDEIKDGQIFVLNILYTINYSHDFGSDEDIKKIIDYIDVIKEITLLFNVKRYNLMESLLNDLYDGLSKKFKFNKLDINIYKKNILYKDKINKINIKLHNE